MTAPGPGWLARMRATIDAATSDSEGGGAWVVTDPEGGEIGYLRPGDACAGVRAAHLAEIATWLLNNARWVVELADTMAAALARIEDAELPHGPLTCSGRSFCRRCNDPWPCPHAQAAEALRAWNDANRDGEACAAD